MLAIATAVGSVSALAHVGICNACSSGLESLHLLVSWFTV